MYKKTVSNGLILLALITCVDSANATLYVRGEGTQDGTNYFKLIYDDIYDVTWYDYSWEYGQWNTQLSFTDNLTINYSGKEISDWRMPSAYNSDGSLTGYFAGYCGQIDLSGIGEFGSLWGQLEEGVYYDIDGKIRSGSPFDANIDQAYWSSTEYNSRPNFDLYLRFIFSNYWVGYDVEPDWSSGKLIVVRSGDIGQVPEPTTIMLFGAGLVCLVAIRLKRKKALNCSFKKTFSTSHVPSAKPVA